MCRLALVPILFCIAAALTVAVAAGDGGPSPGAVTGWDGVVDPGGAVRYVALAGTNTTVAAVRVRDGRVLRYAFLKGFYGVPLVAYDGSADGVSADGKTLVLASFPGPPSAQAVTRFPVLSTRSLKLRRMVTLRGAFSYDAISPDGSTIYLIEYLSQPPNLRYRVRALDATTGRLIGGAIVDKSEPEAMQGYPLARATPPDRSWAFTLYRKNIGNAFVHALDTRHRSAVCIDLPWRIGGATVKMTLTRDGSRLVLRQPHVGILAVVDTRSFRIRAFRKPVEPGSPVG